MSQRFSNPAVFVCAVAVVALCQPAGWRRLTGGEAGQTWRNASKTKYLRVTGDFVGDRKIQTAELLVSDDDTHYGLFITSPTATTIFTEKGDANSLNEAGIGLVRPGRYETACGKGYGDWACGHGEPDYLDLKHEAIDYFYNESSEFIFYWDAKTKSFKEIQMSD